MQMPGFRLASPFSDHMVLQRDVPVSIWGLDRPGTRLTITSGERSWYAQANADGRWKVEIGPFVVGPPFRIDVQGTEHRALEDVLAGEVWLASGQSNMEWPLGAAAGGEEDVRGAHWPQIRLLTIPRNGTSEPVDFVENPGWQSCTPRSVEPFSALAYHFGRELHEELGVPVGLICNAWGGATMESYTRLDILAQDPLLSAESLGIYNDYMTAQEKQASPLPEERDIPAMLYNGMVHPLVPFMFRGVIWYQGESNTSRWDQYRHLSELMISDWRRQFGHGDFPFLFVQLAGFETDPVWLKLMLAQQQCLEIPNTGMAVAADIGDATDIHPRNKRDVGHRLALIARAKVYGQDVICSGPTPEMATREGSAVRLRFGNVGSGLVSRSAGWGVKGFEMVGADGDFKIAEARLDGSDVVLSNPEVEKPDLVRYAYRPYPVCDLYNREGLPAPPFEFKLPSR